MTPASPSNNNNNISSSSSGARMIPTSTATTAGTPDSVRSHLTQESRSLQLQPNTTTTTTTLMSTNTNTTNTSALTLQNDLDFEAVMKQRAESRREKQNGVVADLKLKVSRLEAALCSESKRRVAAVQNVSVHCETLLEQTKEQLMNKIMEDRETANKRFGAVECRLQALELQWEKDLRDTETAVLKQGSQLQEHVRQIRQATAKEAAARLEREGKLLQQLESASTQAQELYKQEKQERLDACAGLSARMDNQDGQRDELVHSYTDKLRTELAHLQEDVTQEAAIRLYNDEEIVGALNRYTAQLQKSLTFIASDV